MVLSNVYNLGYSFGESIRSLLVNHNLTTTTELTCVIKDKILNSDSIHGVWKSIVNFPILYKNWWLNLVANDPIHVFIETTLILSIIYIIVSQSREWKSEKNSERLSESEKEMLLTDWVKNCKKSLVPMKTTTADNHNDSSNRNNIIVNYSSRGLLGNLQQQQMQDKPPITSNIIVEEMNGRTMTIRIRSKDENDDTIQKQKKKNDNDKKKKKTNSSSNIDNNNNMSRTVLNFATHDFLGMSSQSFKMMTDNNDGKNVDGQSSATTKDKATTGEVANSASAATSNPIKDASRDALGKYGCGSCGPRGFYGTIDLHLQFEGAISKFTNTEGAIMYSDGASTVSSTIAAFAKRGDLLVVDEGCYEPIITGVTLSRANVKWFRHNDMDDLRRVLQDIQKNDKKLGRKSNAQRRFIVAEGLYKNLGSIVPLDELVELKNQYKYRVILDESFSFGTLGPTGKGVLELFNKRHMYDAEIVTISLENSLGSIGGVTVGNEEIVDHQRLSGAGYCFSASLPPFTASAAMASLHQLQTNNNLIKDLHDNVSYAYDKLSSILPENLIIASDERSPIILIEGSATFDADIHHHHAASAAEVSAEINMFDSIVKECLLEPVEREIGGSSCFGVALVSTGRHVRGINNLHAEPPPAIRMTISAVHTKEDIDTTIDTLDKAFQKYAHEVSEEKI